MKSPNVKINYSNVLEFLRENLDGVGATKDISVKQPASAFN